MNARARLGLRSSTLRARILRTDLPMTGRDFDSRSGSRHYGRWSYPWRSEDEWGPIIAAVMFLVILAGLIVSGSLYL
jgi:hypothetical protein